MSDTGMEPDKAAEGEVTRLLGKLKDAPESLDKIMSMVYEDIHRIAHYERSARGGFGSRTTVLVHEAFLKIFGSDDPEIVDRVHLKRLTAMAVRQLIVDEARACLSQKRGGHLYHTGLREEEVSARGADAEHVLAVEKALNRLENHDRQLADIVVGRYYGGYTAEELAELTGKSRRTIQRQIKRARGWLRLELEQDE